MLADADDVVRRACQLSRGAELNWLCGVLFDCPP
eukprot:COSAG03_NODE_12515_length_543_cov_1.936937_1_plen_33_part_10